MGILIPIASGKGGVGKSAVSANLGVALAALGKTVILVDLDLGGSNLHTLLGVKNVNAGIGSIVHRSEKSLGSLIVGTETPRLGLIPGDALLPGTANLDYFTKKKVLKDLAALSAEYVIMDLGSGSSNNVVDFFLASSAGLVVTTPETTSTLNAYSFIKTALFRSLHMNFAPNSPERAALIELSSMRVEDSGGSFLDPLEALFREYPDSLARAKGLIKAFYPRIAINMGRSENDMHMGAKLRDIVKKSLGVSLGFVAFLVWDEAVPESIAVRRPIVAGNPESPFSRGIGMMAKRILASSHPPVPHTNEGNGDLVAIFESAFSGRRKAP
jgi:flagellar biosynthesis protein FlhG